MSLSTLLPSICPKCRTLMTRKYRKQKKIHKKYGFSEWDYCLKCNHIQHYEEFKIKLNENPNSTKTKTLGKRNKKFQRPDYKVYMASKQWKNFKDLYWNTHRRECAGCGGNECLHIHHVHYGYLGREREQDLVPLCGGCHGEFHEIYGTKTVMIEETNEFIEQKRMTILVATL